MTERAKEPERASVGGVHFSVKWTQASKCCERVKTCKRDYPRTCLCVCGCATFDAAAVADCCRLYRCDSDCCCSCRCCCSALVLNFNFSFWLAVAANGRVRLACLLWEIKTNWTNTKLELERKRLNRAENVNGKFVKSAKWNNCKINTNKCKKSKSNAKGCVCLSTNWNSNKNQQAFSANKYFKQLDLTLI